MDSKKIGTFLMVMLVICAVLLLMATAQDAPDVPQEDPTQTTAASTAAGPEEPSEPGGTTEPVRGTEPGETQNVREPVQTEQPQPSDMAQLVERILEQGSPAQTAATRRSYDEGLNRIDGAAGGAEHSAVYALAELAGERRMNPIAGFWMLVSEGVFSKRSDESGALKTAALAVPAHGAKAYAYTDEGVRQLLTDLLVLSAEVKDELELETALLGANLSLEADQISFSESDGCRYAYLSCSSPYSTHILCFYLRSSRGEWIDDVEFQLLSMRHAGGDEAVLDRMDSCCDQQAVSLIAGVELLMTGKTRAGTGELPFSYDAAEYAASLERFCFTGEGERGTLLNYRLRAK